MRTASVVLAFLGLAACGRDPPRWLALPAHGAQLAVDTFAVAANDERTVCRTVTIRNPAGVDVVGFESRQGHGIHHFAVYRALAAVPESQGPCDMMIPRTLMYGAAEEAYNQRLPSGVAFHLDDSTTVLLEVHFRNRSSAPAVGAAVVNLLFAESTVTSRADAILFFNPGIVVSPGATTTFEKSCALPTGATIFQLAGHMHRHGTLFEMDLVDSASGAAPRRVYSTTEWMFPPTVRFPDSAPLRVMPGQHLRFACTYHNSDTAAVRTGASADDEMCVAFALYYPSRGVWHCADAVPPSMQHAHDAPRAAPAENE